MVGIGGPHVRGVNTNGGFQLSRGMREITGEDVRAAIGRARAIELPADREILHLLPRQFILDEQSGIFDPVGMVGARLEVELHIATCGGSALQSAVTCANRAGLEVSEAVLESIASAECTLSADERELGVCVIDIGAHSSDLAVFFEGAVAYTALGAGCVLTGGGAMLPGMLDVTESQLRVPARIGLPVRLSHMPQDLNHPAWAVGIGMVLYAHRTCITREAEDNNSSLRDRLRAMFAASF